MQKDEVRKVRDQAVEDMKNALYKVERVDLPRWGLTLLGLPVMLFAMLRTTAKVVFALIVATLGDIFKMVTRPFLALVLYVDVLLIMVWFFRRILDKMTGEDK